MMFNKFHRKMPLPKYTIHLWHCFFDQITDFTLTSKYYSLLSNLEKKQHQNFHFAKHRHQYLVTRAMIRVLLSMYDDVSPNKWSFSTNRYGRPSISENIGTLPIRFNLSHTDGLVVCGIMLTTDLGVDVEKLSLNHDGVKIADRYFSTCEVEELKKQPEECRMQRFFDYWTLKEAYIKARGMGLSIPLGNFCFHIGDRSTISITFDRTKIDDDPKQWKFWRFRASHEHQIAVGVKCNQPVKIFSKQIIPLMCYSEFQTTEL